MVNFVSKNIFKVHWKFNFENPIWKIFPSSQHIILTETRNIENKIAKFHSVDLNTGKFLWKNFYLDSDWWVGVEGVYNGVIIFHEYERPDSPIHKNIIAVDLINHSIIWQLPDVRFISAMDEFIFAVSNYQEERKYFKINLNSGGIVNTLSFDEIKSQLVQNNYDHKNLIFPISVSLENIQIQSVNKYLFSIKKNIVKEVDLIQNERYNIIGYSLEKYNGNQILYNDYISIIDNQGREIFKDQLIENAYQIISPRFFIDNGYLIYIKNKTVLNCIYLN